MPKVHVPKSSADTLANPGINSNISDSDKTVEVLQQQFRAAQHDLAVAFAEQKSLSAVQQQEVGDLETTLQEAKAKLKETEVKLKSMKSEHGQALNVASTKESQKLLLRDRITQLQSRQTDTQNNQKDLSKKIIDVKTKILECDASIATLTSEGQAKYEKAQKDLEQPRMVVAELETEVKALTIKLKEMQQIQAVSLEAITTIQAKTKELASESLTDAAAIAADKKIYETIRSVTTIEGLHSQFQAMLQNEIEEFDREEKEYSQIRDRFTKQYEEFYPQYQEYLKWEKQRQIEEANSTYVSAATAAVKSPGHSPGWNLFKFLNHDSKDHKDHKDHRESKKELRSIFSSVFSTKSATAMSHIDSAPIPTVDMLAPRIELSLLDAVPEIRSIENDSDLEESSNPKSPVLVAQPDPRVNSVTAAEALADPAWPPVFDSMFDSTLNQSLDFSGGDALNFDFMADGSKSKPLAATSIENKSSSTVTAPNNNSNTTITASNNSSSSTLAANESSNAASSTNHHNSSNTSNSIAKGFKRTFSITRRRASSSGNSNGTTSGAGNANLGAAGNSSSDGTAVGSSTGDPHHSKLMRKISFFQK
ncbi:hypothetical protein DV453_002586 [Geotrichum candidum]|nr:hypothetical protein DV453_002586 [Geotrichum candidum]